MKVSIVMIMIIALLLLISSGLIIVGICSTTEYDYAELGNPIMDFSGASEKINEFVSQISSFFQTMLQRESIAVSPTGLYLVTYNVVDSNNIAIGQAYVIIYGSITNDMTQFDNNQNYFKVYAFQDVIDGNLYNTFDIRNYFYMYGYNKTEYGYLIDGPFIYHATGSPVVHLLRTSINGNGLTYVFSNITKFDMLDYQKYNFQPLKPTE